MLPVQFGQELVLGTRRKWLRPKLPRPRPRRWPYLWR